MCAFCLDLQIEVKLKGNDVARIACQTEEVRVM